MYTSKRSKTSSDGKVTETNERSIDPQDIKQFLVVTKEFGLPIAREITEDISKIVQGAVDGLGKIASFSAMARANENSTARAHELALIEAENAHELAVLGANADYATNRLSARMKGEELIRERRGGLEMRQLEIDAAMDTAGLALLERTADKVIDFIGARLEEDNARAERIANADEAAKAALNELLLGHKEELHRLEVEHEKAKARREEVEHSEKLARIRAEVDNTLARTEREKAREAREAEEHARTRKNSTIR